MVEYQVSLNTATAHLSGVETQAKVWKTMGDSLLEEGLAWMRAELEIAEVRKLVGQLTEDDTKQRKDVLNREINRLEEAKRILISL